jgi:hypothetical protein
MTKGRHWHWTLMAGVFVVAFLWAARATANTMATVIA